jgi:catechol 2,3-dioxygenase-like lactoylglutathione lyase family enzyme
MKNWRFKSSAGAERRPTSRRYLSGLARIRRAPRLHRRRQQREGAMIDHTSLGVKDFDRAVQAFTAMLKPLGYALQRLKGDEAAFGTEAHWGFFLYPAGSDKIVVGERAHVAFAASSRTQVEEFHRAAAVHGAKSLRPPGARADISPEYYGTVVADADGHTLEAVFWDRG